MKRAFQIPVEWLGRVFIALALHCGGLVTLILGTFRCLIRGQISRKDLLEQVQWMGIQSIPIVLLTATLAGFVTSQQGGYQFTGSIPLYILGSVVTSSVVLELGPMLTAIVLIGRVGARITAELGTMQVSEQLDALVSLGKDPVRTLAAPRIVAGTLVFPLLVAIANLTGVFAGMLGTQMVLGLGTESFLYGARLFWHSWDLYYSVGKGIAFGFVVPLIAVHMGLRTNGGAAGVGIFTTRSVIFMLVTVLVIDALFPTLFLN